MFETLLWPFILCLVANSSILDHIFLWLYRLMPGGRKFVNLKASCSSTSIRSLQNVVRGYRFVKSLSASFFFFSFFLCFLFAFVNVSKLAFFFSEKGPDALALFESARKITELKLIKSHRNVYSRFGLSLLVYLFTLGTELPHQTVDYTQFLRY